MIVSGILSRVADPQTQSAGINPALVRKYSTGYPGHQAIVICGSR